MPGELHEGTVAARAHAATDTLLGLGQLSLGGGVRGSFGAQVLVSVGELAFEAFGALAFNLCLSFAGPNPGVAELTVDVDLSLAVVELALLMLNQLLGYGV